MSLEVCEDCGSVLSAWEDFCGCNGPRWHSNREALYAVACAASEPLHVRDLVRLAETDYGIHMSRPTANAVLSPDPRFCWAGKGIYGLYRHGPLPGPRNLEEVARVMLVAAARPMHIDVLDYCMKRIGYRFNNASLRAGVDKSWYIDWDWSGICRHDYGDGAQLVLRDEIPIVPDRQRAAWLTIRDAAMAQIDAAIFDRNKRLLALADPDRFGLNWDE